MAKQQVEVLKQINTSLPIELVEFLERQAAITDRTVSGTIRHLVASAARLEPPPPPQRFGVVLPSVESNAESIEAARALIAEWNVERARIQKKRRNPADCTSAAEDDRDETLRGWIELVEQRIKIATLHLKPNGGRHAPR